MRSLCLLAGGPSTLLLSRRKSAASDKTGNDNSWMSDWQNRAKEAIWRKQGFSASQPAAERGLGEDSERPALLWMQERDVAVWEPAKARGKVVGWMGGSLRADPHQQEGVMVADDFIESSGIHKPSKRMEEEPQNMTSGFRKASFGDGSGRVRSIDANSFVREKKVANLRRDRCG